MPPSGLSGTNRSRSLLTGISQLSVRGAMVSQIPRHRRSPGLAILPPVFLNSVRPVQARADPVEADATLDTAVIAAPQEPLPTVGTSQLDQLAATSARGVGLETHADASTSFPAATASNPTMNDTWAGPSSSTGTGPVGIGPVDYNNLIWPVATTPQPVPRPLTSQVKTKPKVHANIFW